MDLYGFVAPRRGRFLTGLAVAALLGGALPASAELRLTDPASELYYTYGLLAGGKLQVGERAGVTATSTRTVRSTWASGAR